MAKKEKVTMLLKDGVEVHDLDELQANFDLIAVMDYFKEGKLLQWLDEHYYDDEAEKVEELSADTPNLGTKLCAIFGVEAEGSDIDMESLARLKEKQAMLRNLTDNQEIIDNAMYTAFNQEDLAELLDEKCSPIYLCGEKFTVSARRVKNTKFVGILNTMPEIVIKATSMAELEEKGLSFKAVKLPENLIAPQLKVLKKVINMQCKKLIRSMKYDPLVEGLLDCDRSILDDNNSSINANPFLAMLSVTDILVSNRLRRFKNEDEKQTYIDVICQGEYTSDEVLFLYAKDDYTYGFAFTTDSFCYITPEGRAVWKYIEIKKINYYINYGHYAINDMVTGIDRGKDWDVMEVLKNVCRAIGVNVK